MLVILFLFSRAADIARLFRLRAQLHRLIHTGKWTQLFRQVALKSNNLCGSGSGGIFALPLPQKKDRFYRFRFHIPAYHRAIYFCDHKITIITAPNSKIDFCFQHLLQRMDCLYEVIGSKSRGVCICTNIL